MRFTSKVTERLAHRWGQGCGPKWSVIPEKPFGGNNSLKDDYMPWPVWLSS